MYCIIIAGATGQGKTTFAKTLISRLPQKKVFVFDVNNEFSDEEANSGWTRHTELDKKKFLEQASGMRNTAVLIEDATGFFSGRVNEKMLQLAQAKRHSGNTYIFLFHSVYYIPENLQTFANYTVLFRTNDEPKKVFKKFPGFAVWVARLKKMPKYSKFIIKNYDQ